MPAGGFRTFVAGETLDEDKINDYLMQGILVFDDAAARGSAIPSPVHGQVSFLKDTNTTEYYDSTGWEPVSALTPSASGGTESDITVGSDTYRLHAFTSNGSLTVTNPGVIDLLVVGGGAGGAGGGAGFNGGGGGAGGYISLLSLYMPAGTATIVIGAGGSAGGSGASGGSGTASSFTLSGLVTQTALGGGSGSPFGATGGNGASGGGAQAAGRGTLGVQGFDGGTGAGGNAGSGGGAAGAGGNNGAAAGAGIANSITGSSVTYSAGGLASVASPTNAPANSGKGGEGKAGAGGGSAGGSGVVYVRYKI